MSISAYKKTIKSVESARAIERKIFAKITNALAVHQEQFDNANSMSEKLAILHGSLRASLSENMKLWSALKMDLMHEDNKLPPELRAQLISLALFVERHVNAVLAGQAKVKVLIEINQAIMAGLVEGADKAGSDHGA